MGISVKKWLQMSSGGRDRDKSRAVALTSLVNVFSFLRFAKLKREIDPQS
jgi:hypothetical protein